MDDLIGLFQTGSSIFWPLELCEDIDLVAITPGNGNPYHLDLVWHPVPISLTVTSQGALEKDLTQLNFAGMLFNMFANPMRVLIGRRLVAYYRDLSIASIQAISPCVQCWKDEQFPGWDRAHRGTYTLASHTSTRPMLDLLLRPEERGYMDAYLSMDFYKG